MTDDEAEAYMYVNIEKGRTCKKENSMGATSLKKYIKERIRLKESSI